MIAHVLVLSLIVGLAMGGGYLAWNIYQARYYDSEGFLALRRAVAKYVQDYNALNAHIAHVKAQTIGIFTSQTAKPVGKVYDTSIYNFKRKANLGLRGDVSVHHCSLQVLRGAQLKPFEYVCKYFGIAATDESLTKVEMLLNDYLSIDAGINALHAKRSALLQSLRNQTPKVIFQYSRQLPVELGMSQLMVAKADYPVCRFSYISAGGNSSQHFDIVFTPDILENFIFYLAEKVRYRKSAAGQRALMTRKLRNEIKARDGYACRMCKNSIAHEPNLLLEIDHIIPVSKGGITTRENLQTLCWRCNRSKGSKIIV